MLSQLRFTDSQKKWLKIHLEQNNVASKYSRFIKYAGNSQIEAGQSYRVLNQISQSEAEFESSIWKPVSVLLLVIFEIDPEFRTAVRRFQRTKLSMLKPI